MGTQFQGEKNFQLLKKKELICVFFEPWVLNHDDI